MFDYDYEDYRDWLRYSLSFTKFDKALWEQRNAVWKSRMGIPIEIVNAGKYWFNKPMKAILYVGEGIDCPDFAINGYGDSPEEIQNCLEESVQGLAILYYGSNYKDSEFADGGVIKRKWKEYLDLEKIEKELK